MSGELYYPQVLGEPTVMDKTNLGDGFSVHSQGQVQKALIIDMGDDGKLTQEDFHYENQVTGQSSYAVITSSADRSEAMGISGAVKLKYKVFTGEAAGSFDSKEETSTNSISLLYRKSVTLKTLAVPENMEGVTISKEAAAMSDATLLKTLGGYYVSKIMYGAALEIDFTLTTSETTVTNDIKANAKVALETAMLEGSAEVDVAIDDSGRTANFSVSSTMRVAGSNAVAALNVTDMLSAREAIDAFNPKADDEDLAVVGFQVRSLPITMFRKLVSTNFEARRYEENVNEAAELYSQVQSIKALSKSAVEIFGNVGGGDPARPWKNRFIRAAEAVIAKTNDYDFIVTYLQKDVEAITEESIMTWLTEPRFQNEAGEEAINNLGNLVREVDGLIGKASVDLPLGAYDGYALRGDDGSLIPEYRGILVYYDAVDTIKSLDGLFKNGLFIEGTVVYENGDVYNGDFKDGKAEGKGKLTLQVNRRTTGIKRKQITPDETPEVPQVGQVSTMEGAFTNGVFIEGTVIFVNGDDYAGDFDGVTRRPEGIGIMNYAYTTEHRRAYYEGEWVGGLPDGEGCLFKYNAEDADLIKEEDSNIPKPGQIFEVPGPWKQGNPVKPT